MKKISLLLLLIPTLFACDTGAKQQLVALANVDSLRQDSLLNVKNQLLNDVLVSTQFVNDINAEIAKARSLPKARNATALASPAEGAKITEDRAEVLRNIRMVVQRLDAASARVVRLRREAAALSQHDSTLTQQIAEYENTIAGFRATIENQKQQFQAIVDSQNVYIASLHSTVDTLTNVKAALADTMGQLIAQRNTAYYIVGTRDELERDGILVEEGRRQFWLVGNRRVEPSRTLEPAAFTRIDITTDTSITLPDGEYSIFSRQDPELTRPFAVKDGRITGGLSITNPREFWAPSRFLILMKR
ncbi:MAG TPA: hypothetical protein VMV51_09425 [Gemmatimonadaceae bacterium]|nr:hypothetical protein [Gemmatimonadaceae bacterium]